MADLNTALRNSLAADAVSNLTRLDIIESAGPTVLLTYTITWAAGAAGVQAVQSTPIAEEAVAAGTADAARLYKDDDTPDEQITGLTVGTSGANVTIDNTSISNGQTVNLTALTITIPEALAAP